MTLRSRSIRCLRISPARSCPSRGAGPSPARCCSPAWASSSILGAGARRLLKFELAVLFGAVTAGCGVSEGGVAPQLAARVNAEAISLQELEAAHRRGETLERLIDQRSEEHTSELQSLRHLVCRLLLEKKKKIETNYRVEMKNIYIAHLK